MGKTLLGVWAAALIVGAPLAGPHEAHADKIDKIGKKLLGFEAEVKRISAGIRRPKQIGVGETRDIASRRLIDAQVNFGVGNYDDAAVMLYDFIEKNPKHPSFDEAVYYLAESLFQKGDSVASRSYFMQLVRDVGTSSKYYQQALERLVELTMRLNDPTDIDEWLGDLDKVPAGKRRASVPYVKGKYYFFKDQFPKALTEFARVPRKSEYYFQAQYFTGASHIALKSLGKAAATYQKLVRVPPENTKDRRVIELSHMALARVHYERDQPSKAIDRYLMISRRSDLFDEVLYEIAWVYVKNKAFEKALRALELLALANPTSSRMPDVKILEGNLRIRRAQRVAEDGKGNPREEYDTALKVFETTRETFKEPRAKLLALMREQDDPRKFMAQITGRTSKTFEVHATLPEVAAAWLRDEPDVQRIIGVEDDLGQIRDEIADAEETIRRLEQALSTPSRVNIFPSLAEKRNRSTEILEALFDLRTQLATHERKRFTRYANGSEQNKLRSLQARRAKIDNALATLPDAGVQFSERIQKARRKYDLLDQRAAEVSTVIDSTEAQLIALEKFMQEAGRGELSAKDAEEVKAKISTARKELRQMRTELVDLRREAVLAKDRAGTGDDTAQRAKVLRKELRKTLDEEHQLMKRLVAKMNGKDQTKAQQILSLTQRANSITLQLDTVNTTIDDIVEHALVEVKGALRDEAGKLTAYKREYENYEVESRELGGIVLGVSFEGVAKKFYDVLIRSEVGVVDVAWSIKEAADAATKGLNFDRARERKVLDSDFADVVREVRDSREQELFNKASGRDQ